ncbi:MAG: twin transmembrane helix small protein [Janthinobacterium lividum]
MKTLLIILIGLLMFATLGVLIAGLVGLARGGGDPRKSNRLMRYRVLFQAGAVVLFVILLSLLRS